MAKLTADQLRKIVAEEVSKKTGKLKDVESAADDAEETDADELADTLAKHVDMMKALKIEESRLTKRLLKIKEEKLRLAKLISK